MVILKTILNSFQILEFSFQKIIEFATKKLQFFFAKKMTIPVPLLEILKSKKH
jgi:hypothetical protein